MAFPLGTAASTQSSSASPLLLPPKPPTEGSLSQQPTKSEVPESEIDFSSQKGTVLSVLTNFVKELDSSIQTTVAAKLKPLEDDWEKLDPEILKLLVELSHCKNQNFSSLFNSSRFSFLDLNSKDTKNASTTHRKIVMKGCSKPWLHAIRQIIMNLETANVEEPQVESVNPLSQ